jgi:hypothetical protein
VLFVRLAQSATQDWRPAWMRLWGIARHCRGWQRVGEEKRQERERLLRPYTRTGQRREDSGDAPWQGSGGSPLRTLAEEEWRGPAHATGGPHVRVGSSLYSVVYHTRRAAALVYYGITHSVCSSWADCPSGPDGSILARVANYHRPPSGVHDCVALCRVLLCSVADRFHLVPVASPEGRRGGTRPRRVTLSHWLLALCASKITKGERAISASGDTCVLVALSPARARWVETCIPRVTRTTRSRIPSRKGRRAEQPAHG